MSEVEEISEIKEKLKSTFFSLVFKKPSQEIQSKLWNQLIPKEVTKNF